MSKDEIRLQLFKLLWRHPPREHKTLDELAIIVDEIVPWIVGERTAREHWSEDETKDTP